MKRWSPTLTSKGVTNNDLKIFELATGTAISELPEDQYYETIEDVIRYIKSDLGIRQRSPESMGPGELNQYKYEMTRTAKFWRRHYGFLTLGDIKEAFELQILGRGAMERDKSGDMVALGHYQNFSLDYQAKVLNAYQSKRSNTLKKISDALPNEPPTVEEQQANRQKFIEYFYEVQNGWPELPLHWTNMTDFIALLQENGHWSPSFAQRRHAYKRAQMGVQKKLIDKRNATRYGKEHVTVQLREVIAGVFDNETKPILRARYRAAIMDEFLSSAWTAGTKFENLK